MTKEEKVKYYYRFIYKDGNGQLGYTIVHVFVKDVELAIAKFETNFPDLVWRRTEFLNDSTEKEHTILHGSIFNNKQP